MEAQNKYAVATRNGNQETGLATRQEFTPEMVEKLLIQGDLSKLNKEERVKYYFDMCNALGLNPLLRPFDYLTLQGKTVLYANKGCAEQLRDVRKINIQMLDGKVEDGIYQVKAIATVGNRREEATGFVPMVNVEGKPFAPEMRANLRAKAETKAKRRATFAIAGLGAMGEREDMGQDEDNNIRIINPADGYNEEIDQVIQSLPEPEKEPLDLKGQKAKDLLYPSDTTEGPSPEAKENYQKTVRIAMDLGIKYTPLAELTDEVSLLAAGKALASKIREARETQAPLV